MLEELNVTLKDYNRKWARLINERQNKEFFAGLKPVAVGWKVADKAEYDRIYEELRLQCDKIIETWMNDRWIAKLHLKESKLPGGIEIIKLMQRRLGSDDALGLDHVDFFSLAVTNARPILESERNMKWSLENNDAVEGYSWLSVWFDGTEAKLKAATVLDIITQELQELNQAIKA